MSNKILIAGVIILAVVAVFVLSRGDETKTETTGFERPPLTITLSYLSWIFATVGMLVLLFFIWRMNGFKKI